MVIKLDLRIPGRQETISENKTGARYYLVFITGAVFLLTAIFVFILGGWKFYSLSKLQKSANAQMSENQGNLSVMESEFSRVKTQADDISSKLDFVLGDLPTVEIMTALDSLLPQDIVLSAVKIGDTSVEFDGTGTTDDTIMKFIKNISQSPIFSKVGIPVITGGAAATGRTLRDFTVVCTFNSLEDILNSSEFSGAGGTASGDAAVSEDAAAQGEGDGQ